MKRKLIAAALVAGSISSLSLSVFALQATNNTDASILELQEKKEHINNNPYIPQEKKNLINQKLDSKANLISQTNTTQQYISKSTAKSIALQHAGLKESEVKFVNGYIDYDDGRAEYEIEFWKGNTEYDYTIDAITGTILEVDYDIESYTLPTIKPTTPNKPSGTSKLISKADAKNIALQHAGLKESEVKFVNGYLEYDDGRAEYEIEFWKGNTEYDYTIDATTGTILDVDYDIESYILPTTKPSTPNTKPSTPNVQPSTPSGNISASKAKSIALQHAGLSESSVRFEKVELDYDDGRAEYEIEFKNGRTEYDYTIDAATGKILESDMDYDD